MVNRYRGEVPLEIAGRRLSLRLTLGGLAELEDAMEAGDLAGLGERLGAGRLSARDLIRILSIGLAGAGHKLGEDEVRAMAVEGGLAPLVGAIAALFEAAFGPADGREAAARPPGPQPAP